MKTDTILRLLCVLTLSFFLAGCTERGGADKRRIATGTTSTSAGDTVRKPIAKPIINVYAENSGSMNGYVRGVTEFDQIIYSYLSDIKNEDLANKLNLNYINSSIIPQKKNVQKFIDELEPSTFRIHS